MLRALTKDNYLRCLQLEVKEDQQDFVASNLQSIADSKVYPELIPQTIYHEDTMVGFLMSPATCLSSGFVATVLSATI